MKASPQAWGAQNKAIGDTAKTVDALADGFTAMTAAILAQAELHHQNETALRKEAKLEKDAAKAKLDAQKKYEASVAHTAKTMKDIRVNTIAAAKGIAETVGSLLKFSAITGGVSALIGGLGFGELASSTGNARQQAQGLGTTFGNQKAFGVSYSRLLSSPESFLANIANVEASPNLQYGIGARIAQMHAQGMDTSDIGSALIPLIKNAFQQYGQTVQGMRASGLDNLISLQDAKTILANSDQDLGEFRSGYQQNRARLAIADPVLKAWQDFDKQLDLAGDKIDKALIMGLEPLAPKLGVLSNAVADVISAFLARPDLKQWIDDVAGGFESFAKFIGTDNFKKDIDLFVKGVGELASAAVEGARVLGLISRPAPDPTTADNQTIFQWNTRNPDQPLPYHDEPGDPDPTRYNSIHGTLFGMGYSSPLHNPYNIRPANNKGYRHFDSDEEGIRAAYVQIERDIRVHGQTTTEQLIKGNQKWPGFAPAGDGKNNPDAYISHIKDWSGIGAKDDLQHGDNMQQIAKLMAAMARQENSNTKLTPEIILKVIDQPGSNTTVQAAQTAAR